MLAGIEIDLGALQANARTIAGFVGPAKFAAVVKANGYGHGIEAAARALDGMVERFCVYEVSEAVALRDAGVTAPILIFGPVEPADLETALGCDAAITLWDPGAYGRYVASVASRRRTRFRVHIKIETGVTRLGLDPADAGDALDRIAGTPELAIEGIYSHLAAAEELDSDFTLVQLARFLDAIGDRSPGATRHIAASAAALLWPQTRLDMVRVGIALYGLWPSPETRTRLGDSLALKPALRWTTQLVSLRDVAPETSIGYGRTYRTAGAARIGVLPIGYAEGIPRAASNRGSVLIDGKRCPIVGRVCMNMTMVDVSGVPHASTGDSVTLIGSDGAERIGADDWGRWCDTIDYEIVARLPREIPRTYLDPTAEMAAAKSIVPS